MLASTKRAISGALNPTSPAISGWSRSAMISASITWRSSSSSTSMILPTGLSLAGGEREAPPLARSRVGIRHDKLRWRQQARWDSVTHADGAPNDHLDATSRCGFLPALCAATWGARKAHRARARRTALATARPMGRGTPLPTTRCLPVTVKGASERKLGGSPWTRMARSSPGLSL